VNSDEYANVAESGEFSMEGGTGNMHKYFATTPEDAIKFGNLNYGKGNFGLTTGEFPYNNIIEGNKAPWPENVITGLIHNGSIAEVAFPEKLLSGFQNVRVLGFGRF